MPKQKTKEIPFSNTATEITKGEWRWITGGITWQFSSRTTFGLNFGHVDESGKWIQALYIGSLKEAATFSEGYFAGLEVYKKAIE